jgi:hypothetical protein
MFLREIKIKVRRKSGKVYRWWVVIKTYWDKEKKKVRHRVIHNLGRDSRQEFCVWLTSFLPNLKLKSCNISYSLAFKLTTGFFHLPSLKFSQIK